MATQNAWSKYIDATSHGDFNTVIATNAGVDPATVGRWRTGAVDPKPRQVVEYARGYGLSPISALIGAGFITAEELGLPAQIRITTLDEFTVEELADELASRLRGSSSRGTVADVFPAIPAPDDGSE